MDSIRREQATRKKAVELLKEAGWACWYPVRPGGKFFFPNSRTDIMGLWDLIAWYVGDDPHPDMPGLRLIQLKTNHKRKIDRRYLDAPKLKGCTNEFWSYDTKKREWTRVHLDPLKESLNEYGSF